MIPYSTLVAMVAVRASPMPVFLSLVIFNWPEVVGKKKMQGAQRKEAEPEAA